MLTLPPRQGSDRGGWHAGTADTLWRNAELIDDGLDDLGDHLLPDLLNDGMARSWALEGYGRDVGTVEAYWQVHQEFLEETPPLLPGAIVPT